MIRFMAAENRKRRVFSAMVGIGAIGIIMAAAPAVKADFNGFIVGFERMDVIDDNEIGSGDWALEVKVGGHPKAVVINGKEAGSGGSISIPWRSTHSGTFLVDRLPVNVSASVWEFDQDANPGWDFGGTRTMTVYNPGRYSLAIAGSEGRVIVRFYVEPNFIRQTQVPSTPPRNPVNLRGISPPPLVTNPSMTAGFGRAPASSLPDLQVTDFRVTGRPAIGERGIVVVPVQMTIRNQGAACGEFKVAAFSSRAGQPPGRVPFVYYYPNGSYVPVGTSPGNLGHPGLLRIAGIGANSTIALNSWIVVGNRRPGSPVTLWVEADPRIAPFVTPPGQVREQNENNNRSRTVAVP